MSTEVTMLLQDIARGDGPMSRAALDRLLPVVYDELRRLAGSFLNREHAVTMQTTELVHEAYFRLTNQRAVDWENRGQFFAIAAQAMRRILVDAARHRAALKNDGERIPLDEAPSIPVVMDQTLFELDSALDELAMFDPRQSQIVELRYFGGLTVEETAEVLKISPSTVKREWSIARSWLFLKVNGEWE